jgi:hypothetical protein
MQEVGLLYKPIVVLGNIPSAVGFKFQGLCLQIIVGFGLMVRVGVAIHQL